MVLDALSEAVKERLRKSASGLRIARGVFFALAAALAGAAQFLEFWPGEPSGWQILGILASICVFVGSIYVAFADDNAPHQLEVARRAVELASEEKFASDIRNAEIDDLRQVNFRFAKLYLSVMAMRQALERLEQLPEVMPSALAKLFMEAIQPHLATSLNVETWHRWTFGIYEVVETETGSELVCVAKQRAIECSIAEARRWPVDRGIMGVSIQHQQEVLISDSLDPSVRMVFNLPDTEKKPEDDDRYRSFAVSPIVVGNTNRVWGVAIATNDQPGHFDNGGDGDAAELVRAVAAMFALGVIMCDNILGGSESHAR